MKNLVHRLRKKGWEKKEVLHAVHTIKKIKEISAHEFLHERMFWILLVVIIVANFAIAISLIPLFLVSDGIILYFILAVLGIVFGLLIELVIRSIEHLERIHHLWLSVLIPIIALLNAFFITRISNRFDSSLGIDNFNNPLTVGVVYSIFFVLPYIFYRFVMKIEYYLEH